MTALKVVFGSRLPQLGGRWVPVYRAICCLLAVTAVALLAVSLLHTGPHPAILALRLLKGTVVISVSAILLRRRGRDPVAALLALAFLTWTITSSFDFASANLLPMLLDRVRFLLFALALLLFPDGSWRPGWTRTVAVASTCVFLLGLGEGIRLLPTHLFLPLAIACVAAAVAALFSRFRTAESEAVRQQLKWVALGLVAGIGLILCARAGAAVAAASPRLHAMPVLWEAMFQLGIVIVALGFLVSLLRYRLFDAETAISRSAVYAALTITIVAIFAATEATIENLGQMYFGMGLGNASAAAAAAVAAVLLNPLHSRISDWAEHHFQRDLVLLKRDLPKLLEDLAPSASPAELAAAVLPRIGGAVHATRSALVVRGGRVIAAHGVGTKNVRLWSRETLRSKCQFDRWDSQDRLFPVRLKSACPTGPSCWIVLGPRPDGTLYGKEDIEALEAVLPAIRRTLAWSIARESAQASIQRQWEALRRQVRELQNQLTSASS